MCAARSACLWLYVVAGHRGCVQAKPLLLQHTPESPLDFRCDTIDPVTCHSGCANGTTCFMKKDYKHWPEAYASCCCNANISKEVEQRGVWSCYVTYKSKPAQTHGTAPFCAVHCCKRPLVSRACHGNDPVCCDARVSQCGIDASGRSCCASLRGNTRQCSHLSGRTCGWLRTSWLTFMPTRVCPFVDGLDGCYWTCAQPVSWELFATGLFMVSGSWALHSRFQLDALATRRAKRRRVLWLVFTALVIFGVAWWARHEWLMCLLWTGMCLAVALVPVLCWHLHVYLRDRCRWQHVRHRSRSHGTASGNKRLAVLINQERYEGGRVSLKNDCLEPLRIALTESGWEAPSIWKDLRREDFMPLVRNITENLEGTSHAQVLIVISCHLQNVAGMHYILPVDAGYCILDGVSVLEFLRELGRAKAHSPHFAVLVGGCVESTGRLPQLSGLVSRPDWREDGTLPYVGQALFSVFWGCHPGRTAHGEWFTKKLCEFLSGGTDENISLNSFSTFMVVDQRERPEEGVTQFPCAMTMGRFLVKVVQSAKRHLEQELQLQKQQRPHIFFVNNEEYWYKPQVRDESIEPVADVLRGRGCYVQVHRNLMKPDFRNLLFAQIQQRVRDTTEAQTMIYMSVHSHLFANIPQILPVESGWFASSIDLWDFMRDLGCIEATRPHFCIVVNGCLTEFRCWHRRCANGAVYKFPVPTKNDASFEILCACDPGRRAYGDWLTRALLWFLREGVNEHNFRNFAKVVRELHKPPGFPQTDYPHHPWKWDIGFLQELSFDVFQDAQED